MRRQQLGEAKVLVESMSPSNNIAHEWIGKTLVGLPLELFEAGGE